MKSKKILIALSITVVLFGCNENNTSTSVKNQDIDSLVILKSKAEINNLLDSFNIAAANADYNRYFNYFSEDAIFIGTDATENWNKNDFMIWAKPYFDKGKTWKFKSLERNIYFDQSGKIAWYDELLNTQMKICRGSGVVMKKEGEWKIQQYVLSMTIPNDLSDSIVHIKSSIEDSLIDALIKNN